MNAPNPATILESLPAAIREQFEAVGRAGRGPLGRLQTQQIVDNNIELIRWLRAIGTHADLAAILSAVGITSKNGTALTAATLSSAISRAESKTPKPRAHTRQAPKSTAAPCAFPDAKPARLHAGTLLPASQPRRDRAPVATVVEGNAADRAGAIPRARRDHEIARDYDPRAAIFDLLDTSKED
jgi:hypothetical protein